VIPQLCVSDRVVLSRVDRRMQSLVERAAVGDEERILPRVRDFVGSVARLRWARNKGCPWDEQTCARAAAGGHLDVLMWARENDCPWDEKTCSEAARGGFLKVLQEARGQNPPCPWDKWTCAYAAAGGHLDVLKWARDHDCPWDRFTCAHAARGGHLERC
jgi:hypothetical protein